MESHRKLTKKEILTLEKNGCVAESWETLEVAPGFDAGRVHRVRFSGRVVIGDNSGYIPASGFMRPCGIYNATVSDCLIGNNVLIANIGSLIRNYIIEDNVLIEDVSVLDAENGALFGNGQKVNVMNESGGREVTIFDDLNAQVAYLQAMYRHDSDFQEELERIIQKAVAQKRSDKGSIGRGAVIRCCGIVRNMDIGPSAIVEGASELINGTVHSCSEHPTFIGGSVILKDFIVAEGAKVESGALLERVFIGQGVQAGKQVFAEDSLFFANSEAFQSEICSVFAGPFTVTHHKSTLLIAGLWSFFNAGSGTNQSNHMYKLGPVHQGVFERGCKSGSFSYHIEECHIAPFSTIIGKHMSNVNISLFPFSFLTESDSRSHLLPGLNIFSIGTVRDEAKWPARDRRKAPVKRDLIIFDVFSPYTVEKMRRGRAVLRELVEKTPRHAALAYFGGVHIKRLLLRKSIKYYSLAIDRYLIGKVIAEVEKAAPASSSWKYITRRFQNTEKLANPDHWLDIGGLIAPFERIENIVKDVRDQKISTIQELLGRLNTVYDSFSDDELSYVCFVVKQEYGLSPDSMTPTQLAELADKWESAASSLYAMTMDSVKSEFSEASRISYGIDQDEERRLKDFIAVRGTLESNSVTRALLKEGEFIRKRIESLKQLTDRFL